MPSQYTPAWFEAVTARKHLGDLEAATRRILLRVCAGYRTIALPAVEVWAGIPPVRFLASERCLLSRGVSKATVHHKG